MNLVEKILELRVRIGAQNLRKSGQNKFAGYTYFELKDFLPEANSICKELKILPIITFSAESAEMKIIDGESKEIFSIATPMSTADLKGCHQVQNLGAVQTYLRRYLWIAFLELSEGDVLDATHSQDGYRPLPTRKPNSISQMDKKIQTLMSEKEIKKETLLAACEEMGTKYAQLTEEGKKELYNFLGGKNE